MKNLTDEQLVQNIQSQKDIQRSFELIIHRFQDRVFSRTMSFVNDYTIAENLTQEIFAKVYFSINTFQFQSKFGTWLFKITTNHCLNYVNKKQPVLTDFNEHTIHENTYDDANLLESDSLVQTILSRLPERTRSILIAKYLDNYTYKELADIFECTPDAIKTETYRARKKFIELYTQHD